LLALHFVSFVTFSFCLGCVHYSIFKYLFVIGFSLLAFCFSHLAFGFSLLVFS